MLDLSVVIVTYNSEDFIVECLENLYRVMAEIPAEVIVVDNASTDRTVKLITDAFPNVILVKNEKNFGFGKAHNVGMTKATGRYRLLLNPDVLLASPLKSLVQYLDNNEKIGILGIRLLLPNRELQPHIAGKRYTLSSLIRTHLLLAKNKLPKTGPASVDWVTGAFFLIRQQVVETLGGFDENYFLYFEDQDYCWRARKAGWQVVYFPEYEALHYHGVSSSGNQGDRLRAYYASEDYFFAKKYSPGEHLLRRVLAKPIFWWRLLKFKTHR